MNRPKAALLSVLALLLSLAAAEGGARWLALPTEFAYDWEFHPELGHTGPRSRELVLGEARSFYNELGFRSDWLETPAPDSSLFSLLILGDSMTEQNDLAREVTYPGRLRETLQAGKPVRLHTFASADYGTAEAVVSLSRYGHKAAPDLVVLQFLGLNDYVNNTLALAGKNKSWSDFARPYLAPGPTPFTLEAGGLSFTRQSPLAFWLMRHSRLFLHLKAKATARQWDDWVKNGIPPVACATELRMFLEEPGDEWKKGIAATAELLKGVRNAAGKALALAAYFPSNVELDDGLWEDGIVPELGRCFPGAPYSRHKGEERFLELAREAGFDGTVSLWPSLAGGAPGRERDRQLFIPGGHYAPKGHGLAAEAIRRAAEALLGR